VVLHYPDVSHWNDPVDLTGVPLVIAKATQGTTGRDPAYARIRDQAAAKRIPFAAYHWLDTSDPVAQARHCYSVVGGVPLMIDDEQPPISVPHTLDFVRAYRALGGRVGAEYLPHWTWTISGRPDLTPLTRAGLILVSSHYTSYSDTGPGWTSYGGVTPAVWQYADHKNLNGRYVDYNAYQGTAAQLLALIAGGQGVPDMELTDKTSEGVTVDGTLVDVHRRTEAAEKRYVPELLNQVGTITSATLPRLVAQVTALTAAVGHLSAGTIDVAALTAAVDAAVDAATADLLAELHQLRQDLADARARVAAALTPPASG
jgi:hypothetical protein